MLGLLRPSQCRTSGDNERGHEQGAMRGHNVIVQTKLSRNRFSDAEPDKLRGARFIARPLSAGLGVIVIVLLRPFLPSQQA